jgi:tetratricopeptide (TPR) repeat protein
MRIKTTLTIAATIAAMLAFAPTAIYPAAAQNTVATEKTSAIQVRVGQQGNASRVVFDFPVLTGYKTQTVDGDIELTFTTPLALDVPKTKTRLVLDIWAAKTDPATAQVTIRVPKGATYKHFRMLKKIIVDISPPPGGIVEPAKTAAVEKPVETKPAAEKTPAPPPANADEQLKQAKAQVESAINKDTVKKDADALEKERAALEKKLPDNPAVSVDIETAPEGSIAMPPAVTVGTATTQAPSKITLSTMEPTRLAVFPRFDALWIVSDSETTASQMPVVSGPLSGSIGRARVVKFQGGTAFRYFMPPHAHISVNRRNLTWEVTLSPSPVQAQSMNAVSVEFDNASRKSKLLAPLKGGNPVLNVTDPDSGTVMRVVPATIPADRIEQARQFPNVAILPAASGMAAVPLADDLRFTRIQDFIIISAPDGIAATPNAFVGNSLPDKIEMPVDDSIPRLFNFPGWRQGGIEQLNANRRKIEHEIAATEDPESRSDIMMKLALLYFSNNFGQETLGILRVIESDNPLIAENPNYLALRGAAAAMAGHYDEALKDLSNPAIQQHPEVNLWIGYVAAATEQWQKAARSFPKDRQLLSTYPPDIALPMTIYMAESLLRLGKTDGARAMLDGVATLQEDAEPRYLAAISYLKGEIARQEGKTQEAIDYWRPVADGLDRLYHTKAALALANLELQAKKITLKQAVDDVDSLRFAWRGDGLEVQILHSLGLLRAQNGHYLQGLQDLKAAALLAERMQDDPEPIRRDISRIFMSNIFPGGASVSVPPLEAISVYNEFRDQIPPGEAGSDAMLKVADYMINIDLLGKAAGILESEIGGGYMQGAKIVETGIKLAAVYLLDGMPEKAIATIDKTGGSNPMTEQQKEDRELMRARALSQLNRMDEAAAVLSSLDSKNARKLKADLLWRAQKWTEAAAAIESILPAPDAGPISDDDANLVINAAVAHKLSGNAEGLQNIRDRFSVPMQSTKISTAFSVVTRSGGASSLADRGTIMKIAGEVDMFKGFLDSYKASAQ